MRLKSARVWMIECDILKVYILLDRVIPNSWSGMIPELPQKGSKASFNIIVITRYISFLSFPVTKKFQSIPLKSLREQWGLTKHKKVRSWARVNTSRNPCLLGAPSVSLAIHSPHCQIHPPAPLIQTNSAWVCGSEVACMFRFVGLVFFITSTDRIPMMQLLIF